MIQQRTLPPISRSGLILSRSPRIEEIYEKLQLAEEKLKEGKSSSQNCERIKHFHHGILALRGLDFGEGLNGHDIAVTRNWKLSQITEDILIRVVLVNENLRLGNGFGKSLPCYQFPYFTKMKYLSASEKRTSKDVNPVESDTLASHQRVMCPSP